MLTDLKRTLVGATVSLTVGVAVLAAPVTAQAQLGKGPNRTK